MWDYSGYVAAAAFIFVASFSTTENLLLILLKITFSSWTLNLKSAFRFQGTCPNGLLISFNRGTILSLNNYVVINFHLKIAFVITYKRCYALIQLPLEVHRMVTRRCQWFESFHLSLLSLHEQWKNIKKWKWSSGMLDPVALWMSLHLQFVFIRDFLFYLLQNIGRKSFKLHKLVELLSDAEDLCLW